jgi:aminoglycoside 3-N-acetyltransferase
MNAQSSNSNIVSFDKGKAIWTYLGQKIYSSDIKNKLKEVGLVNGDIVMGHFDLGVFGKIAEIRNKKEFYNTVMNAILSVVGENGALIIPTYSYSLCRRQVFDIRNTKPSIGTLSRIALEEYQDNLENGDREQIIRSNDPIFSCIGFGNKAKLILENLSNVCFGDESVFGRLYRFNAKLMGFGFMMAMTYMHFVERKYHETIKPLKYRYNKIFDGTSIDINNQKHHVEYTYFVRDLDNCEYDFKTIPKELERKSLLNTSFLGAGEITLTTAHHMYNTIFEMLKKDEFAFLTKASKNKYKSKKSKSSLTV